MLAVAEGCVVAEVTWVVAIDFEYLSLNSMTSWPRMKRTASSMMTPIIMIAQRKTGKQVGSELSSLSLNRS